ncbi:hypothetical protein F5Y14DRAFT_451251 [Nemania sp. NC0429]|nr:hypothetical protein F5Y14DRAFT_451251 [Nemania sp. NC0429]
MPSAIIPKALEPGATIAFVSPSARLNDKFPVVMSRATAVFMGKGYRIREFTPDTLYVYRFHLNLSETTKIRGYVKKSSKSGSSSLLGPVGRSSGPAAQQLGTAASVNVAARSVIQNAGETRLLPRVTFTEYIERKFGVPHKEALEGIQPVYSKTQQQPMFMRLATSVMPLDVVLGNFEAEPEPFAKSRRCLLSQNNNPRWQTPPSRLPPPPLSGKGALQAVIELPQLMALDLPSSC